MTAREVLWKNLPHNSSVENENTIIDKMQEYTKLKCQELLEIVAKKAKIIDEDGDVYEQPMGFYCQGELYEILVDKDSILNAVNLDEFIN